MILAPALGLLLVAPEPDVSVTVSVEGCPGLDQAELTRRALEEVDELALPYAPPPPQVTLRCLDDEVELQVFDPVTGEGVTRRGPAFGGELEDEPAGLEPDYALIVGELVGVTWPTLLDRREAPTPSAVSLPAPTVSETRNLPPPPAPESLSYPLEITVRGGPRLRGLDRSPQLTGGLRASFVGYPVGALGLGLDVGLDGGTVQRDAGDVALLVSHAGPTVVGRGHVSRRVELVGALHVTGLLVSMRGSGEPNVSGGSVLGISGELGVSFGPRVRFDRAAFVVEAHGGAALAAPRGQVDFEADATAGGAFAGLRIGVMVGLGRPR